ncbi:hypothetical protein BGX30_009016 [Mortierella sp. GBA39]|nr:hypothetical protein BGX30_009016 [Mortierella sp. GBA39]
MSKPVAHSLTSIDKPFDLQEYNCFETASVQVWWVLKNCPHFRLFDAIVHRIEADHILGQPLWVCKDPEFCRYLGHEYLNNDDLGVDTSGYKRYPYSSRTFLAYNGPILETMDLSLSSGQDRLGALKSLEVFGSRVSITGSRNQN